MPKTQAKPQPKMFTTDQLANRYGVTRQRVWQIANSRGLKPEMIGKRFAMWSMELAVALEPRSFTISEKARR